MNRKIKANNWKLIDIDVRMKRKLLLAFTYIYAVIVSDSYREKASIKVNMARRRDGGRDRWRW